MPCSKAQGHAGAHKQVSTSQANKKATPPQINKKVLAAAEHGTLAALLPVISRYLPQMNLVNLSTSVHRLAKFVDKDPEAHPAVTQSKAFENLKRALYNGLINPTSTEPLHQSLSNITWSLAHLYATDMRLVGLLASLSTSHMAGFKPFELSTLLWAFAKLGLADELPDAAASLFGAASTQVANHLQEFSYRCLTTVAYAFATARQPDLPLFSCLARQMRCTVDSANCQEIGNTAWAFASVGHCDRKLMAALARAALPLMHGFKAQEISNMLWGFASLGFRHEEAFARSVNFVLRLPLNTQHLANIIWACAKVLPKQSVMDTVIVRFAPFCTEMIWSFRPQEVSSIVQSLAKVLLPKQDEAPELVVTQLCKGHASLHADTLALLVSLAEWIDHNGGLMPSPMFVTTVSSLISLGKFTEQRLDLIVVHAVVKREGSFPPSAEVSLLRAFLSEPCFAREPVAILAARLATCVEFLHGRDLQAFEHLYLTVHGAPFDRAKPSQMQLHSWCMSLAMGLSSDKDGESTETTSEAGTEVSTSDDDAMRLDAAQFGSAHRIPTAESLAFLDWQPVIGAAVGMERGQILGFGSGGLSSDEKDGESIETTSEAGTEVITSDDDALRLDAAQFGSAHRIPTAESLAFLDWQPAIGSAVGMLPDQIPGFGSDSYDLGAA